MDGSFDATNLLKVLYVLQIVFAVLQIQFLDVQYQYNVLYLTIQCNVTLRYNTGLLFYKNNSKSEVWTRVIKITAISSVPKAIVNVLYIKIHLK